METKRLHLQCSQVFTTSEHCLDCIPFVYKYNAINFQAMNHPGSCLEVNACCKCAKRLENFTEADWRQVAANHKHTLFPYTNNPIPPMLKCLICSKESAKLYRTLCENCCKDHNISMPPDWSWSTISLDGV